eukprot:gene23000-29187_t
MSQKFLAGKNFLPGEVVNEIIGIPTLRSATSWNILENYVDGISDTHGYAMIFNHAPSSEGRMTNKAHRELSKVHYGVRNKNQMEEGRKMRVNPSNRRGQFDENFSQDQDYVSNWAIFEGDQIFSFYGDNWFSNKKFGEVNTRQQTNRDVTHIDDVHDKRRPLLAPNDTTSRLFSTPITSRKVPGCTTLLTVYDASTQTLRAARDIRRGTIIEVSRALLVPEFSQLKPGPLQQFLWWSAHWRETKASDAATRRRLGSEDPQNTISNSYHISSDSSSHRHYFQTEKRRYTVPTDIPEGMNLISKVLLNDTSAYDPLKEDYTMILLGNGALYSGILGTFKTEEVKVSEREMMGGLDEDSDSSGESYREIMTYFDTSSNYDQKVGEQCRSQMMVSFTASRDIQRGEELIIDVMIDQDTGFRYPHPNFVNQCL